MSLSHAQVMPTSSLIIDLDQSDKNQPVPAAGLVQRHRYNELKKQIELHLETLSPSPYKQPYPAGSGWVFFVDGTRGAGKSTFLYSVEKALTTENILIKENLAFVALIDPSRVERSEIILLSVLQHLKKKVGEAIHTARSLNREQLYEDWRRAFKRVAGGLNLFAPSHHPLNDLDADLFLEWGLERAGHSTDLREQLHALISTACKILGVKALMIAFDDADTDATHALNTLECIRKYFDTPQLMVLVTGDMELYSLLVRQHFMDSLLSKRAGKVDSGYGLPDQNRAQQYLRMVDHLEEQYLLKLFPVRRRLQLLPMWNLLERQTVIRSQYLLSCSAWGDEKRDPRKVTDELMSRGLRVKAPQDVAMYREFLMKQPLRSVLQVLSHCAPFLAKSDVESDQDRLWSAELTEALSQSIRAMALGSLYKFYVDTDALAAHELSALSEATFQLALEDGDMDTAAYLRPMPAQQDLKNCFVSLAAEVPNLCAGKPSALIRYLFAGPGSVTLYDQVRQRKLGDADPKAEELLQRQFKKFMGIGRKEDALNWARHATAIIAAPYAASPTSPVVRIGVIGLNRSRPKTALYGHKAWKTIIREALSTDNDHPHFPVFALSQVDVSGTSDRTYSSIFNILGLMECLLGLENPEQKSIENVLSKPYPALSISSPVWEGGHSTNQSDDGNEPKEPDAQSDKVMSRLPSLRASVEAWLKDIEDLKKRVTPSSVLIGKIWTRLFFSLEKTADELRGKVGAASLMEMFALCVINAFMIEESDHHLFSDSTEPTSKSSLDRTNPLSSANAFIKKLAKVQPSRDKMPLTSIMATCPLLLGLLRGAREKDGYILGLKELFPLEKQPSIGSLLCPEEFWDPFEKICIAGSSRSAKPKPLVENTTPGDGANEASPPQKRSSGQKTPPTPSSSNVSDDGQAPT